MSIFNKKQHSTRSQLRQSLRKASPNIPGSSRMFSREERVKLEKQVFGKKYGQFIDKGEVRRKLLELRHEEFLAKTSVEKTKISRQKRYLEKVTGINI